MRTKVAVKAVGQCSKQTVDMVGVVQTGIGWLRDQLKQMQDFTAQWEQLCQQARMTCSIVVSME